MTEPIAEAHNRGMAYSISKETVITLLGNQCVKCGFSDIDCLVIDHVSGDGSIERGRFNRDQIRKLIYLAFEYNITEAIEIIRRRYQILCANCNMKKVKSNGENGDVFQQMENIDCLREVKELRRLVFTEASKRGWRYRR